VFKKLLITLIITILVFFGFYIAFIYLSKGNITDNTTIAFEEGLIRDTFELPIQSRSYKIGVSSDIKYIKDIIAVSEIINLNISAYDLTAIDELLSTTKADVNLIINVEDDLRVGYSQDLSKKIDFYLETYKQIKYLSIGSSVNLTYRDDNKKYSTFISEYVKIYDELKKNHPSVKIYTTFQYESLIGRATEYYSNSDWNQIKFLDDLSGKLDLIGINMLPIINYPNPNDIPLNYLEPLIKYGKNIALVQNSWPARDLMNKEGKIYHNSTETLQAEYLKKLTEILDGNRCELLIWQRYQDSISESEVEDYEGLTVAIGMKNLSGQDREITKLWRELINIDYVIAN
jgi:hypothetical protein